MTDVQAGARQVVVLGGTGRVGTAVVDELTARGQRVIAVSRRPASVERPLVHLVRGDVDDLAAVFCGVDVGGVVVAVTPFTAPPDSFDGFDGAFYVRIIEQLQVLLPARTRVVHIAVTAIARLLDGTTVAEDPALFPARLRPFSDAHARGADLLATSSSLDGTVLIPAAGLGVSIEPEGSAQPLLKAEPVTIDDATGPLDHTVLARAVAEQLNDTGSIKRLLIRNSPAG
ncbi:NAD(P)H-binding protein [Tsukamurella pulmonis]|uniref:NAD(P)H-binding protein n=1 Tax=Tsukamurella pulmonis TaxID=47312 RepID=UPI001EE0FA75|nr:NAD(P)H-binding protein [Tsukamurella pulmonis]